MKITGFDHLTINVTDLRASRSFYENVLMLAPCGFTDMGDHTLTYYWLPRDVRLELIDYMTKDDPTPVSVTHVGMYRHFCLEVDSLEELMDRCRKYGVTVTKEPSFVEQLGRSNILMADPNGVEIEVFEALPEGGV